MTDICDNKECEKEALWLVYAAYDPQTKFVDVHPTVLRYPSPMIRACSKHIIDLMTDDSKKLATTAQWVVKIILKE